MEQVAQGSGLGSTQGGDIGTDIGRDIGRDVRRALQEARDRGEFARAAPRGGGQCTIDNNGSSRTITCSSLPPDIYRLARGAEHTAFGLMGLLAAIVILGPFARMFARRIERRADMAPSPDTLALRQQIEMLQQSVDSMSIEVERISESQRFQSKLLAEARPERVGHIS